MFDISEEFVVLGNTCWMPVDGIDDDSDDDDDDDDVDRKRSASDDESEMRSKRRYTGGGGGGGHVYDIKLLVQSPVLFYVIR